MHPDVYLLFIIFTQSPNVAETIRLFPYLCIFVHFIYFALPDFSFKLFLENIISCMFTRTITIL